MTLSLYHQKYANHSDEEIQRRLNAKEEELKTIFEQVPLKTTSKIIEVAVLGCADKRFVKAHKKLFEKYMKKPVHLTTFDITTKHLRGEENVLGHDCTKPLPDHPYDITYGHVLLKFIQTDKQWDVIKNSYDTLKQGGIAIHCFDKEEIGAKQTSLTNDQFSVPLKRWEDQLDKERIGFQEIPIKYGLALVLQKQ